MIKKICKHYETVEKSGTYYFKARNFRETKFREFLTNKPKLRTAKKKKIDMEAMEKVNFCVNVQFLERERFSREKYFFLQKHVIIINEVYTFLSVPS